MYLPIIVMLIIALTAGILIWLDILHVDQIIAAVNDNRLLAAIVILPSRAARAYPMPLSS